MKSKIAISAFILLALIGLTLQVQAQLTTPAGGGQAGPEAPFDEGGGNKSTQWHVNANGLHVNGFTNIGIGAFTPQRKLDIYGTANTVMRITSEGGANLGSHVAGIEFRRMIAGGSEVKWDIVNQNSFRIRHSGIPVISLSPQWAQFGNIDTPITLDIWGKPVVKSNGSLSGGAIVVREKFGDQTFVLKMDASEVNTNSDFYINSKTEANTFMANGGGKVGVGTTDDEAKLNIRSGDMQLKLSSSGPINDSGVSWRIGASNSNWMVGEGKLVFTSTSSSADATMVMTQQGYVGIGLTTPSKTLHVNGTTSTKILEVTGGADLAEPFSIFEDQEAQPGMVVTIDPQNAGGLRISDKAYDKTVAGIISGAGEIQPGMIMGQEGSIATGQHPVALSGRVYCKVDASFGAVRPGDLLTTSDTPGFAMKVANHESAQGAIIGKAMTSLEEGQGLVLVLVSLQ